MNQKKNLPVSDRRFWIERISKTALRALHIIGVVGSGGGIIFNLELSLWLNYWLVAIISGVLLMSSRTRWITPLLDSSSKSDSEQKRNKRLIRHNR